MQTRPNAKTYDHRTILLMLDSGVPKKRIAAETGASPRTIGRIGDGEHRNGRDHVRCPGCGGLQIMPCQVCPLRSASSAA